MILGVARWIGLASAPAAVAAVFSLSAIAVTLAFFENGDAQTPSDSALTRTPISSSVVASPATPSTDGARDHAAATDAVRADPTAERLQAEAALARLGRLGRSIVARERQLSEARRRLRALRNSVAGARVRLAAAERRLARLSAAASRAGREPTPSVLAHPDRPLEAARAAMLMRRFGEAIAERRAVAEGEIDVIERALRIARQVEAGAQANFAVLQAEEAEAADLQRRAREAALLAERERVSASEAAARHGRDAASLAALETAFAALGRRSSDAAAPSGATEPAQSRPPAPVPPAAPAPPRRASSDKAKDDQDGAAPATLAARPVGDASKATEAAAVAEDKAADRQADLQADLQFDREADPQAGRRGDPSLNESGALTSTALVRSTSTVTSAVSLASSRALSAPAKAPIPVAAPLRRPRPAATSAGASASPSPPTGPFSTARGRLLWPVNGELRQSGRDALPGATFYTSPAARVIAPWSGVVRLADDFRGDAKIVIIEPQKGYSILIIGLASLDVVEGQRVVAGQPLGRMGGASRLRDVGVVDAATPPLPRERLYLEIAKKRRQVDPAHWFRPASEEVDEL